MGNSRAGRRALYVALAFGAAAALPAMAGASFAPPVHYAANANTEKIAAGQFNSGTDLDLVVAASGGPLSLLPGTAGATFGSPSHFSVAGNTPAGIAVDDLNGDGRADLVVSNSNDDDLDIRLGNGDGTFTELPDEATGDGPTGVATAQLGGGGIDLIAANRSDDTVSVLHEQSPEPSATDWEVGAIPYGVGDGPARVVVGDFNQDGWEDLAVSNTSSDNVSILAGVAAQPIQSFATAVNVSTQLEPVGLAAGDFNGDGDTDLVAANRLSGSLTVLAGGSGASFALASTPVIGDAVTEIIVAELTGDTDPDLAVVSRSAGTVTILRGNTGATFNVLQTVSLPDPRDLVAGNFDGDSDADLAVINHTTGAGVGLVSVLVNTPETAITGGPAGGSDGNPTSVNFTYAGTPSSDTAKFECKIDTGNFADCPNAGKSYTGLSQGQHTFSVRAVDPAGNPDPTPATRTFRVDTIPPAVSITGGPAPATSDDTPSIVFTYDSGATVTCSVDQGTPVYGPCTGTNSHTAPPLADGAWTFRVAATDPGGTAVATRAVTIDTTAPETTIDGGPSGTITVDSAEFTYSGDPPSDTAGFECRLNGATFAPCPDTGKSYTDLPAGNHTFAVRAVDALGNRDQTPATRAFSVAPDCADAEAALAEATRKLKRARKRLRRARARDDAKAIEKATKRVRKAKRQVRRARLAVELAC